MLDLSGLERLKQASVRGKAVLVDAQVLTALAEAAQVGESHLLTTVGSQEWADTKGELAAALARVADTLGQQ